VACTIVWRACVVWQFERCGKPAVCQCVGVKNVVSTCNHNRVRGKPPRAVTERHVTCALNQRPRCVLWSGTVRGNPQACLKRCKIGPGLVWRGVLSARHAGGNAVQNLNRERRNNVVNGRPNAAAVASAYIADNVSKQLVRVMRSGNGNEPLQPQMYVDHMWKQQIRVV